MGFSLFCFGILGFGNPSGAWYWILWAGGTLSALMAILMLLSFRWIRKTSR